MRRTLVKLSTKGKDMVAAMEEADMEETVDGIFRQLHADWCREIEERRNTRIVPFAPCYQSVFCELNEAWITAHWQMEETDDHALNHPGEHILEKGGYIMVALYREKPVGVCALIRPGESADECELSKLAVGIGKLLCEAVIDRARELGMKTVFLESKTVLAPPIRLYRTLGFREVKDFCPTYGRANIRMELPIS